VPSASATAAWVKTVAIGGYDVRTR
jgi:hypothetical protein